MDKKSCRYAPEEEQELLKLGNKRSWRWSIERGLQCVGRSPADDVGLAAFALAPLPRPLRLGSVALPRDPECPLSEGLDISVRSLEPPLRLDISLMPLEDTRTTSRHGRWHVVTSCCMTLLSPFKLCHGHWASSRSDYITSASDNLDRSPV